MTQNEIIKAAYELGYRVDDSGRLISNRGNIRKTRITTNGYLETNIRLNGKLYHLPVHRLCAYQKFGNILFSVDCVRHLDGTPTNNKPENIEIGSLSDNAQDIPRHRRIARAKHAASCQTNYNNDDVVREIKIFHNRVKSYKKTMEVFDISSKGTLYYILNKR